MLNENAKKWVAALRSGEYRQAQQVLRKENKFCCLGVACDLYGKEHGIEWKKVGDAYYFLDEKMVLPKSVKEWLGTLTSGTFFEDKSVPEKDRYRHTQLSSKNDRDSSFAEIADIIESEPEGLFVK
jgi:hypothetical protein